MLYSKEYASILNDALSSALKNILNSQEDSSSRIVADLVFNTTDGYKIHYIASHDGNNGYRSYGFQIPSGDVKDGKETNSFYMATFSYYSKTFNSDLPLSSSNSPLIQNPDIQRKLGSYDYVVYKPNGEIVEQKNGVNVGGRYDSKNDNDNTGLKLFINEVILPVMNKYNLSYATFRYMYAPRLTTDENGNYKYTVAVTERVIEVGCADKGGYYDSKTGNCVYSGVKKRVIYPDEIDFQILREPVEYIWQNVYYDERTKTNRTSGAFFEFNYLVFPGIVYCDNVVLHEKGAFGWIFTYVFSGYATDKSVGNYKFSSYPSPGFFLTDGGVFQYSYSPHNQLKITYTYHVGNKSVFLEEFRYKNSLPFSHDYTYILRGYKLKAIYDWNDTLRTGRARVVFEYYKTNYTPPGWFLIPVENWSVSPDRTRLYWKSDGIQNYLKNGGDLYNILYPDKFFTEGGYWDYIWGSGYINYYRLFDRSCDVIVLDWNTGYGITLCDGWYDPWSPLPFGAESYCYGNVSKIIDLFRGGGKPGPAYVKSMTEKINYKYETEADVKTYMISANGDITLIGYTKEKGIYYDFNLVKVRNDLSRFNLEPKYFIDKIISIRKDSNEIVPYTSEGLGSSNVAPLKLKDRNNFITIQ